MAETIQVVFDCANPDKLADFWALALGYVKQPPPEGYASWQDFLRDRGVPESEWDSASAIVDPEGAGPRIYFQKVPEAKVVKNRVHLDVNVGGGRDTPEQERRSRIHAAVERLTGSGATRLHEYEQNGEYWIVMQDPEGNEFCLQ